MWQYILISLSFYTFYILGDCSAVKCGFGATCKVVGGLAKCNCDDFTCADSKTPVCGSDGKTYGYKCLLLKEQCAEQTAISVIHDGECGEFIIELVYLSVRK